MKQVHMYTDGGARGNPGPSGIGAVIKAFDDNKEGEILAEVSKYIGETTNNQAEYLAVIHGLKKAKELNVDIINVFMDSELAVSQLNGIYKVKNEKIAERFVEVHNLRQQFREITFTHIYREKNKEADALVNKAIDEALA